MAKVSQLVPSQVMESKPGRCSPPVAGACWPACLPAVCQTRGRGGNQDIVWCPEGIPASACSCQSSADLPLVWKAQQEADSLSAAATAGCGALLPAALEGCSFHGCRNSSLPRPPRHSPGLALLCQSLALCRQAEENSHGALVSMPSAAGLVGELGARRVAGIAAEHTSGTAAPGLRQEAAPRQGGGLMGWRGVPGLPWAVGSMPALVVCFMFIASLMWQPSVELLGCRGAVPDTWWWQHPGGQQLPAYQSSAKKQIMVATPSRQAAPKEIYETVQKSLVPAGLHKCRTNDLIL